MDETVTVPWKRHGSMRFEAQEYMVHMWRPGGNLPPVEIQYDLMRSVVEAQLQELA